MNITLEILLLGLFLTVFCIYLDRWQPPIKEQYKVFILAVIGSILGYIMLNGYKGILWGIVYTGIVFYREVYVDYIKKIKDTIISVKKDTDDILDNSDKNDTLNK